MDGVAKFDPISLNEDRLSNLPLDILDTIISKLPLEEAVKTSILSKQWRYNWYCLSNFVLEDRSEDVEYSYTNIYRDNSMVYRYLHHHRDAIFEFKIENLYFVQEDLRFWMDNLSTKNMKKLYVHDVLTLRDNKLVVPSSVFEFPHLQSLTLRGLTVQVPKEFGGMKHLTCLSLSAVTFYGAKELENLIRKSSALQRLKLSFIRGVRNEFRICGVNIQHIHFDITVEDYIMLENTEKLSSICYPYYCGNAWKLLFGSEYGLSNLEILEVHACFFLGFLSHVKEQNKYDRLSELMLNGWLDLNSRKQFSNSLDGFGLFPNLKKLSFGVRVFYKERNGCENYVFPETLKPINLNKLEEISVYCGRPPVIRGLVSFLSCMTGNSHLLKVLDVERHPEGAEQINYDRGEIIDFGFELETFHQRLIRISPKVKIIHKLDRYFSSSQDVESA